MISGVGHKPQITGSPSDRTQMKNDCQREQMSPAPKKKYISPTNHDGGAPKHTLWTPPLPVHMFLLPIATDTPITLYTPLSCKHFSATNHDGRTKKHTLATPTRVQRQRLRRNTSPLPITTAAPKYTLCPPLHVYRATVYQEIHLHYQSPRPHHFPHPM